MRFSSVQIMRVAAAMVTVGFAVAARGKQAAPTPSASAGAAQNATGQSSTATSPTGPASTSAPPAARAYAARIEVPGGTRIPLVLHNAISTRTARPGDPAYFETLFPVLVDGRVVIPAGSYVSGEVTESKRPGRVKGRGELMIKLTTLILPNAYTIRLDAAPGGGAGTGGNETMDSEGKIKGAGDKASDVGTVIRSTEAGTGIGAGVGAAAGNVGKGAGIGAAAGVATGLATVLLTRGPEAELPRGTTLEAVLDRPLYLDADKVQFTSPGQASTLAGPPNREPQRPRIPF